MAEDLHLGLNELPTESGWMTPQDWLRSFSSRELARFPTLCLSVMLSR